MKLRDDAIDKRKRVASVQNQMLVECEIDARVDHRSLKKSGIQHDPERQLAQAAIKRMTTKQRVGYVARWSGESAG
jgi:hypothetical protein